MNNNLQLREFSTTKDVGFYYSCQREAEMRFLACNITGDVRLCKVVSADEKIHLLWISFAGEEVLGFLPVFVEDMDIMQLTYIASAPVNGHELIYKNGAVYLFEKYGAEKINVRRVYIFAHQKIVEEICRLQGYTPKEIYLERMLTLTDNKELTTCWNVVYDSANPETFGEECSMLLPVDTRDAAMLKEIGINSLNFEPVYENAFFTAHGIRYLLQKDENGKRYVAKSFLQLSTKSKGFAKL